MCEGDCCKKESKPYETVFSQPPAVWIALAVGFVVASAIRK